VFYFITENRGWYYIINFIFHHTPCSKLDMIYGKQDKDTLQENPIQALIICVH
jgi:hypothetical protein